MLKLLWLLSYLAVYLLNFNLLAEQAKYAGSQSCASCHQAESQSWQGSHHDLAMQEATEKTVLGNFNNQKFIYNGITTIFFRKSTGFYVRTDGPDGQLQDFKISYTFGVFPLQQYLITFPDGRLQALSICWDSRPKSEGGERWFHLYPKEKVDKDDLLHWTKGNQNWNFMCADCHSTNLQKNYNSDNNTFNTTWSEINIGCESCHGPASKHLEWAKDTSAKKELNKGLIVDLKEPTPPKWIIDANTGKPHRQTPKNSDLILNTCAPCHSRRSQLAEGRISGQELTQHYLPSLLTPPLYHNDGQINDEVYEYGSFLQSKMYAKGVTCTDCHNPHSLKLKFEGNNLCTSCHLATKYDSPKHTFHKAKSPGSTCVSCHMPAKTYMQIDTRHDHSFRIPRPDLSEKFGTPNACNQCHQDKTATWATDYITKWYGSEPRSFQNFVEAFDLARKSDPRASNLLTSIVENSQEPDIVRATALQELVSYLSPHVFESVKKGFTDKNPLVRLSAIAAIHGLDPSVHLDYSAKLLNDPQLAVRNEVTGILATIDSRRLLPEQLIKFDSAIKEYERTQMYAADRPEQQINLGIYFSNRGEVSKAENAYKKAIALEPLFVPSYVNLADLYRSEGRETEAEKLLRKAINIKPPNAEAYQSLGLLLVRTKRLGEALGNFKMAMELQPENPRYCLVYALALQSSGAVYDSYKLLQVNLWRYPQDPEILGLLKELKELPAVTEKLTAPQN